MEKATITAQISDSVEFRHHHLTHPTVTPMDCIVHGVNKLTCTLYDAPHIACDNHFFAMKALHQAIQQWTKSQYLRRRIRIIPCFHKRAHDSILYCALCAVPMKTDPQTHLQGWPFQILTPPQYQHHYHPSQINMNQLLDAPGPDSPTPWTSHLQG